MQEIVLAGPRGFCAGVAFAIEVVELALKVHGAPLYVRHAIVHNEFVVKNFEAKGVIFIEDVMEVPEGMPIVFSAHGVAPLLREQAAERNLKVIDGTCPLVTKVHNEAKRFLSKDYHFIYIGHKGHVEAEGTMGEAPDRMVLIETPAEAEALELPHYDKLAVLTQTTLSISEVTEIMTVLRRRFPHMVTSAKEDICYATTNRQGAVHAMAKEVDLVLVVGSTMSSNSNRLREVAESYNIPAYLLMSPEEIQPEWRTDFPRIGITSGASTPEELVEAIIGGLIQDRTGVAIRTVQTVEETMQFIPPRDLIQLAQASG